LIERTIATGTHGRYRAIPAAAAEPAGLLVGFHGYGENAAIQLERLRIIPGSERWHCVSIQGLHRFYQRRDNSVVASWMTREDRELAIADNLAYVARCLDAVAAEWPSSPEKSPSRPKTVFAGFSQGVAMAFRAAANVSGAAVIAVGGDVPPDLTTDELQRLAAVLIARGKSDEWYTEGKFAEDQRRLRECSVNYRAIEFSGGHEWTVEVSEAASEWLRAFLQLSQT
jgi:predicted esterase